MTLRHHRRRAWAAVPYAKGATGNVAHRGRGLHAARLGIETGIDLDTLVDAGVFISNVLGRKPISRVGASALLAKRRRLQTNAAHERRR